MVDVALVARSLRESPRPLRLLAGLFLRRTGLCRLFTIRHRDFIIRFFPTEISFGLFLDPEARGEDHDFFRGYLRPGDVVVDVGANVGTLALTASRCAAKVYAIEAHPRIFRMLEANIALNRRTNIVALNAAAGDKEGVLTFSDFRCDDRNCVIEGGQGIEVPSRRLDDWLKDVPRIDLLKIDVEGFEKWALAGAGEVLKRTSCLYFESFDANFEKYGYDCREIFDLLRKAGFTIYRRDWTPLPKGHRSASCENLLASRFSGRSRSRGIPENGAAQAFLNFGSRPPI